MKSLIFLSVFLVLAVASSSHVKLGSFASRLVRGIGSGGPPGPLKCKMCSEALKRLHITKEILEKGMNEIPKEVQPHVFTVHALEVLKKCIESGNMENGKCADIIQHMDKEDKEFMEEYPIVFKCILGLTFGVMANKTRQINPSVKIPPPLVRCHVWMEIKEIVIDELEDLAEENGLDIDLKDVLNKLNETGIDGLKEIAGIKGMELEKIKEAIKDEIKEEIKEEVEEIIEDFKEDKAEKAGKDAAKAAGEADDDDDDDDYKRSFVGRLIRKMGVLKRGMAGAKPKGPMKCMLCAAALKKLNITKEIIEEHVKEMKPEDLTVASLLVLKKCIVNGDCTELFRHFDEEDIDFMEDYPIVARCILGLTFRIMANKTNAVEKPKLGMCHAWKEVKELIGDVLEEEGVDLSVLTEAGIDGLNIPKIKKMKILKKINETVAEEVKEIIEDYEEEEAEKLSGDAASGVGGKKKSLVTFYSGPGGLVRNLDVTERNHGGPKPKGPMKGKMCSVVMEKLEKLPITKEKIEERMNSSILANVYSMGTLKAINGCIENDTCAEALKLFCAEFGHVLEDHPIVGKCILGRAFGIIANKTKMAGTEMAKPSRIKEIKEIVKKVAEEAGFSGSTIEDLKKIGNKKEVAALVKKIKEIIADEVEVVLEEMKEGTSGLECLLASTPARRNHRGPNPHRGAEGPKTESKERVLKRLLDVLELLN